jgi:histone H2B
MAATTSNTEPPIQKKKKAERGYSTYIHQVLKQVHPDKITISTASMEVMNQIADDLEKRVASKAFDLAKFQKKSTLSAKHVQTATKMLMPPEMGGLAVSEGSKAVGKFARK